MRDKDSIANTLLVAIGVSLVCSVLVAGAAVLLKPTQQRNEDLFRKTTVLEVAGLMQPGADVDELFSVIEPRIVDLQNGAYVDSVDPLGFDPVAAANDPATSVTIPGDADIANIRNRAIYAPVYLVMQGESIRQIILPVHGAGLWSTMYGYLALEDDGVTVSGFRFYRHAETPGLGDQVDDPAWLAQWVGKRIAGPDGQPRFEVVRGPVHQGDATIYQVDGLSGATLTGRGVTNLIRYWTGPYGFGPYLDRIRQAADDR